MWRFRKLRQVISFDDRGSLHTLNEKLRADDLFQSAFFGFAQAVVLELRRLELEHGWHFVLLDNVAPSDPAGRNLDQVPWLADKHKPGEEGWVGVEVLDFVSCMSKCEEDADFWEVWVHAYCIVKCGIQSGTGGGPLFK